MNGVNGLERAIGLNEGVVCIPEAVCFDNAPPDDDVGYLRQVLDIRADGLAESGALRATAHDKHREDGRGSNDSHLQQNSVEPSSMCHACLFLGQPGRFAGFFRPPAIIGSHPESRPFRPSAARAIS
jgi:hypothetical protein